ncbi:hypothetical protein NKJ02_31140 [Mesorhizobium sp. M0213]
MLLLAYCAGLRRGELARLDIGDVNLHGDTITVRQTKFANELARRFAAVIRATMMPA